MICEAKHWLEEGSLCHHGDGRRVRIWVDGWIPELKIAPLPPENCDLDPQQTKVLQITDNNTKNWDIHALYSLFSPLVAAAMLKIPPSQSSHVDKLIWGEEKNGNFSVHNTYHLIQ